MEIPREKLSGTANRCRILLVGIGSAGCRTLGSLIGHGLDIPESIAIHTDQQVLEVSHAPRQHLIGQTINGGLSTGGNVQLGAECAEADKESLRDLFGHYRMIFFITGLGGGTGNGATPVFVEMAREEGAFTLCMAVMPFEFEGANRAIKAESGLARLKEISDGVVVFPNQRLFELLTPDIPHVDAIQSAGRLLADGMVRLWQLLNEPGIINLDFGDVMQLVRHSNGTCTLASVECSGKNRLADVIKAVKTDILFERGSVLAKARSVLIGIIAGPELSLMQMDQIHRDLGAVTSHEVVYFTGLVIRPEMKGKISLTVLATEDWLPASKAEAVPREEASELPGFTPASSHFSSSEQSLWDGQDLDIPTFIRRGLKLAGG